MKHRLSAIVLAQILALGGAAHAQTSASINQTGQDNTAYAEQSANSGGSIAATIVQSGTGNHAGSPDGATVSLTAGGILQTGNRGNTTAEVRQTGNNNLGMVVQEGVTGKYARLTQTGNSNTGSIAQQGGSNGGAALTQVGDDHRAAVRVVSANPRFESIGFTGVVEVTQFHRGNRAEVLHTGVGKTTLVQAGINNTAKLDSPTNLVRGLTVEQYGRDNTVSASTIGSVRQYGATNNANLTGSSSGFQGPPEEYGARNLIEQNGTLNSASINQRASHGDIVASINQQGSSNVASIETSGRFGATTQIEQRGLANTASISQSAFQAGNISISQQGTGHRSTVQQRGFALEQASTAQTGGNNTAEIVQAGYLYNEALISQDGYRNRAVVAQGNSTVESYSNVAKIYQQGNDFQAAIGQVGTSNHAVIRQR
ncbi:MAG: hypothetical protein JWR74_1725 [Polaromonas sp.]|nr:hypothetical protein [Polaromonas sp.]